MAFRSSSVFSPRYKLRTGPNGAARGWTVSALKRTSPPSLARTKTSPGGLRSQARRAPRRWFGTIASLLVQSTTRSLVLLAFDTTNGKQLWRQVVGKGNRTARGDEGNSASPSPSTDGKHVWVFFGSGDLACYDVAGSEVWKQNVQDEYGRFQIQFGMSSTPVLHNGRLYMQLIHSGGAQVLAIDAATGKNDLEGQPYQRRASGMRALVRVACSLSR